MYRIGKMHIISHPRLHKWPVWLATDTMMASREIVTHTPFVLLEMADCACVKALLPTGEVGMIRLYHPLVMSEYRENCDVPIA
jgi:hypothetical protein